MQNFRQVNAEAVLQGKGLGLGAMADYVHSIRIVNGDGELVEYDATHLRFN